MSTHNSTQLYCHEALLICNDNGENQQACYSLPPPRLLPPRDRSSTLLMTPKDKISPEGGNVNAIPQIQKKSSPDNAGEGEEEDLPPYLFLSSWTETLAENSTGIKVSLSYRQEKFSGITLNRIPHEVIGLQPNNQILEVPDVPARLSPVSWLDIPTEGDDSGFHLKPRMSRARAA